MKIAVRNIVCRNGLKSAGLCIIFVLFSFTLHAQKDSSATKKAAFLFNLDSRNTFIDHKHINIWGVRAGVSFGKKLHRLTLGYYWLGYNGSHSVIRFRKMFSPTIHLSSIRQTDVQFVSLAYWYPILKTPKWILSAPVEIGLGKESSHYKDFFEDLIMRRRERYFQPFQLGIYAEHRLTPWAGLNIQVGYRNALSKGNIRQGFGGVYYSYGLTLYPGTIYKDIRKWRAGKK